MEFKLHYRPDIDGLRAIAVLSVLFYHAGMNTFSGGFVGVDVFFVISGYLITSIIVREIRASEFTLANFYERRIRRIYPALFVVVAFTLLAGALLFDIVSYTSAGKSAISVTFFLSNVLFWTESGYFDRASTLKPLLHAWSLSVEEQFYILFPLLMALIARHFQSRFGRWLTGIALASLTLSVYWVTRDASAAFYLMQFRAWELLTGSLLALDVIPTQIGARLRNALSLTGLMLILTSVFVYDHGTPFPGAAALPPVLGSALIIYAGMDGTSLVCKALSLRPIVFIGKISYSLYLWHWPLLVFMKYYLIREPTAGQMAAWLLATFAISTLSWRYIENPFRARTFLAKPRIFVFAGSVMTLSLIASAAIYINEGFPVRFNPNHVASLGWDDPEWKQWADCVAEGWTDLPIENGLCKIGSGGQPPEFLLWGDSHAYAMTPALNASAARAGIVGYMTSMAACPPLLGVDREGAYKGHCHKHNEIIVQFLERHPEIETVFLSARWALSADGRRYKAEEGLPVTLVDMMQNRHESNAVLFDIGLRRTVAKMAELGRTVVIVAGVPEIGYDVPSAFFIAVRSGRDPNAVIAPTMQEYLDRNRVPLTVINALKESAAIKVIDPSAALCDEFRCAVIADGQLLYRDGDHLSPFGARYISFLFNPIFEDITSR